METETVFSQFLVSSVVQNPKIRFHGKWKTVKITGVGIKNRQKGPKITDTLCRQAQIFRQKRFNDIFNFAEPRNFENFFFSFSVFSFQPNKGVGTNYYFYHEIDFCDS